jgi:two-component sensor histidine kinase
MRRKEKKLKHQFLLIVLLSSIPFFIIANILTLNLMIFARTQLQDQIENTTIRLHNTFEALLRTNVNTYLRSKVETGSDLINLIILDQQNTGRTLQEKKKTAEEILLSIQVGKTGYFYVIDSEGFFIFHPDRKLIGKNRKDESPINYQIEVQEGFFEYEWQNTYETQLKKKALFMTYIPEFDWILTATSYRDEFTEMIDRKSIRDTVTTIKFGESGYSYVVNRIGEIIAHPLYQNSSENDLLAENDFKALIDRLFLQKEGYITYQWRDDENSRFREKIVYGKYIEDFDWVVGTAMYANEVRGQVPAIFFINMFIAVIVALLLFIIVRKASNNIEHPISGIYKTLNLAIYGDLSVRTIPSGPIEIKSLGKNLNNFIAILEARTQSLEATIIEKDFLLHEIQHRTKNNLQMIISILNIQSDYSDNIEVQNSLLSTRNRVSAMAYVYDEMLSDNSDFERDELCIVDFLTSYTNSILSSVKIDYSRFSLSCNFDPVFLRRNAAISLGLILNELLSYSIRDLDADMPETTVRIFLKQLDDLNLQFTIEDNLCSFGPEKLNRTTDKSAYLLVDILTQQISGSTSLHKNNEIYSYQITFPFKA